MHKLIAAALIAASLPMAPAVIFPAFAVEIDCTDPDSPGNRPGGYCSQSQGDPSLSVPVDATPPPPVVTCTVDAGRLLLPEGARIHVAVEAEEYLC
jgi:hypothetical protein